MKIALLDRAFYEHSGGGITLSGGEVLQQADFATMQAEYSLDDIEDIADNAFEGCDKLTIYGIKGSYAEQYATEHNIPFTEIKE